MPRPFRTLPAARIDRRQRFDEHTDRVRKLRICAAVADGEIQRFVFSGKPFQRKGKRRLQEAARRHFMRLAESVDRSLSDCKFRNSVRLSVRRFGIGIADRLRFANHVFKVFLRKLDLTAREILLFIEGVIVRRYLLLRRTAAVHHGDEIAEQHACRQSVTDDVVDIQEQPCLVPTGIDLCPVQPIRQQIERLHKLLEEAGVRFRIQRFDRDLRFFIAVRLLYDLARKFRKSRFQIFMRIQDLGKRIRKRCGRCVFKEIYARQIVLRGFSVHFPVEIDAALIFRNRITAAFPVMPQLRLSADVLLLERGDPADGRRFQNLRNLEGRAEFL